MKNAPQAAIDLINSGAPVWRADLITITFRDASIARWTTSNLALVVGGQTYAAGPIVSRSYRQTSRMEVDTYSLEVAGAYPFGTTPLSTALYVGSFDDARIQIDHIIGAYPGDVGKGSFTLFAGRVAGVDPGPVQARIECKTDFEELSIRQLPRFTFRPQCGFTVYDANCGVNKTTFTTSTTVYASPAPTASAFALNATRKANNYYNLGVVAFTSGSLAGLRRAVRSYDNPSNVVTLSMPLPSAPAVGDAFTIYPGCSRSWVTCNNVFANTAAIRSYPHIPTSEGGL